jgi:ferredoxin
MTYVVTENCIKCKYTTCVAVCPTDCFRDAGDFLVIDPSACIDCALCVTECPADAIYSVHEVPLAQRDFIALNAELALLHPVILAQVPASNEADTWNGKPDKRLLIDMASIGKSKGLVRA